MNEQTSSPAIVRRSSEELIHLVTLYERSVPRLTVKKFCIQHQITESAFYSAKRRYGVRNKAARASGFTAIHTSPPPPPGSTLFARVGEISLYQPVGPDYLKALLS